MKRKNMLIERLQEENKRLKQENAELKRQLTSVQSSNPGLNPNGRLAKIKQLKEVTGCDLKTAVAAVDKFSNIQDAIKWINMTYPKVK